MDMRNRRENKSTKEKDKGSRLIIYYQLDTDRLEFTELG